PLSDVPTTAAPTSRFQYVHKHTYATGDPKAAAYFVASYFGGWCNHEPGHGKQHTHCKNSSYEDQPVTWNAYFPSTPEQPLGFSIHFVKNPNKLPAKGPMNETELGLLVEKWRGNISKTGRFDQFMDSHLGLVFDTLDPLVEKWQRDGVPFICRSWCCGPGFAQWPDRCPFGPSKDSDFCEQGCYVEVPHGIILEAPCAASKVWVLTGQVDMRRSKTQILARPFACHAERKIANTKPVPVTKHETQARLARCSKTAYATTPS
ncbi:slc43a2, partial [Symbiodinium sp. KB8]